MKCRRFVSALLALCTGCASIGTLPAMPEQPAVLTVYAAEKEPEKPEETVPAAEETAVTETVTTASAATTETTVTTAETEPETAAETTTTTTAKSSVSSTKKTTASSKSTTSTTTTTTAMSSVSTTKKTTASSKSTTSTTTTTTAKSSVSTTKKTTVSTTTAASVTSDSTVTTVTEAVSSQTAASTTEHIPDPTLIPMLKSSFPGGTTELKLWLKDNPGVQALGVSFKLPSVLAPRIKDGQNIEMTAGALTGSLLCVYNAPQNCIAIDYISSGETPAEPLLCTIPLDIAADAVIGQAYTGALTLDCVELADGGELDEGTLQLRFVPTEPLRRSLPETVSMKEQDGTFLLELSPAPPEGSCTFESSDPDIVSVDENGLLTALRTGTAVITVRCETLVYECRVTSALRRSLLPKAPVLTDAKEKLQLSLSPVPHSSIVWSSADETVATVSPDGTVHAVENGTAEIFAECEGVTFRTTVTVKLPPSLNAERITGRGIGDTKQLTVLHIPADTAVTWESSAPETASVDENGLVTFLAYGTAEITAVCGELRLVCTAENSEYLPGDVDGDGEVTAFDASMVLRGFNETMAGLDPEVRSLTPLQEMIGDVDGDGELTAFDASCILRYYNLRGIAGIEDITWEDVLPSGISG